MNKLIGMISILAIALMIAACGAEVPTDSSGGSGGGGNSGTGSSTSDITVSSNQILSTYTTNMCTQFSTEACIFEGGQRVTFSDGSVMILGMWEYLLYNSATGAWDTNENSVTALIPPTTNTAYVKLSSYVARGTGYKRMFLVYQRSPESLKLVYDTDGSLTLNAGDTTIATLSLSNWP